MICHILGIGGVTEDSEKAALTHFTNEPFALLFFAEGKELLMCQILHTDLLEVVEIVFVDTE